MEELIEFVAENSSVWGGIAAAIVFFGFIAILKAFIRVSLPENLLVVTGRSKTHMGKKFGFTVERCRTLAIPYLQQVNTLDLSVFAVNVRVDGVNSANGITVGADATACVCINDDDEGMLYQAVERLMGKTRSDIQNQIQQTLVGNFRGALNKATPLQAIGMEEVKSEDSSAVAGQGERAEFRHELLTDINSDLSTFGMNVVSVSLQKIWDTTNYISNLAEKTLANKRQDVEIEEARLQARAEKAESDSERRQIVAKNEAEERIVSANQALEVYRQESDAQIRQANLEADNAIAEELARGQRQIQEQNVELQKLQNQTRVILEAEANQAAAATVAEGDREATSIVEEARNKILSQKAELLTKSGEGGKTILFLQQQLPYLFETYKSYAQGNDVDSLLVMDSDSGFSGAVNRGPAAFSQYLQHLEDSLGISVRDLLGVSEK